MRLAITVDPLCGQMGGIGRYTWELINGLRRQREVRDMRYYLHGRWIADADALVGGEEHFEAEGGWFASQMAPLRRAWRKRFYLFHGTNFFLPAEAKAGVITIHDLSVLRFPELHPLDRIQAYEREFSRSLANTDHVITPTETIRREVIASLSVAPSRVTAVPLAAAAEYRRRPADEVARVLAQHGLTPGGYGLSVATIEPRKKLRESLAAWEGLPPAVRSRWPLVVVGGEGWENEAIRAQIERGERGGWVRHLGFFPEESLPHLYSGARLLTYPSTYEGFGLPAVEAMACGVPCLISRHSCLVEVTQGAAKQVDPDDITSYRDLVEQALTDETWRSAAITDGLRVASGYSWDRCARETLGVYRSVLANAL